jgi:hypothetical protein
MFERDGEWLMCFGIVKMPTSPRFVRPEPFAANSRSLADKSLGRFMPRDGVASRPSPLPPEGAEGVIPY